MSAARDDFERQLYSLVCDILRANRSREPESQDEVVAAVQKIEDVAAIVMPQIQELIAIAVTAVNTEPYSDDELASIADALDVNNIADAQHIILNHLQEENST
jgi:hypothetical protein